MKYFIGLGLIVIGLSSVFINDVEDDVLSGNKSLYCIFQDGERKIPTEMIEYEIDEHWKFTNGSASNCRVIPSKEKK